MLENNFKSRVEQINVRISFLGLWSQSARNSAAGHDGYLLSYRSEGRKSKITVSAELRSLQRRWGTVFPCAFQFLGAPSILGLWLCDPSLCLRPSMTFSISLCVALIRTLVIAFRSLGNLGCSHL